MPIQAANLRLFYLIWWPGKKFDLAEHQGEVPDTKAEQKVLTKKEQQLVALIEVGMSNEQIAKELFFVRRL